ncbi:MAG: DUF4412 domain-containing protein, partial [Bdellovibrionota bacterium]
MLKIAPVALGLFLSASAAFADWQGHWTFTQSGGQTIQGQIRMKRSKMRLDLKEPLDASTIIDTRTKQSYNLLHAQKLVMQLDFSQGMANAPICAAEAVEECLSRQGFKKTGSETVDGHPCAIYEGEVAVGGAPKAHVKLWRPTDLKEVPMIRTVIKSGQNQPIETRVSAIELKTFPESEFELPKDYRNMGDMSQL